MRFAAIALGAPDASNGNTRPNKALQLRIFMIRYGSRSQAPQNSIAQNPQAIDANRWRASDPACSSESDHLHVAQNITLPNSIKNSLESVEMLTTCPLDNRVECLDLEAQSELDGSASIGTPTDDAQFSDYNVGRDICVALPAATLRDKPRAQIRTRQPEGERTNQSLLPPKRTRTPKPVRRQGADSQQPRSVPTPHHPQDQLQQHRHQNQPQHPPVNANRHPTQLSNQNHSQQPANGTTQWAPNEQRIINELTRQWQLVVGSTLVYHRRINEHRSPNSIRTARRNVNLTVAELSRQITRSLDELTPLMVSHLCQTALAYAREHTIEVNLA